MYKTYQDKLHKVFMSASASFCSNKGNTAIATSACSPKVRFF